MSEAVLGLVYYVGTPLLYAAKEGHAEIARLLVEHKASMEVTGDTGTQSEIECAIRDHTCSMLHKK